MEMPYDVVVHHMNAFNGNDILEIISDYASDAILVLPNEVRQGIAAIEAFFALQRLGDAPPKLESAVHPAEGNVVVADWTIGAGSSGEMHGKDVFVVADGKIQYQTIFLGAAATAPQD